MKILLVEDNLKLNEAIKTYLEDQGFSVETAFNGVQAISKIKDFQKKSEEYDIIIMDRMMPLKDGMETLSEIKKMEIKSGIIFLTAKDTVEDKILGLAAGADDYIVKPFNVKELVARIHNIYRRKNFNKQDILENKIQIEKKENKKIYSENQDQNKNLNFDFNLNNKEIFFNKKQILLTSKEANIFNILLKNKNVIVSKEDILSLIWDENKKPNSRFVDVHVHNLRNKLLKNNFFARIETIRNSGYKLVF